MFFIRPIYAEIYSLCLKDLEPTCLDDFSMYSCLYEQLLYELFFKVEILVESKRGDNDKLSSTQKLYVLFLFIFFCTTFYLMYNAWNEKCSIKIASSSSAVKASTWNFQIVGISIFTRIDKWILRSKIFET